jgi:nitroimidazol reductase NimA-like FMN-containing flavoprotein (pyridoxamine 5'-phosphate oxidase superfamily)
MTIEPRDDAEPADDDTSAAGVGAPPSARTRVRRLAENARYEPATVRRIVDTAWVCHIGFTDDAGGVHCLPTACWRIDDHVYVHGSNGSRLLKALQSGREAALTVTHLDGLVLARSAFNTSMNYRCATIYGRFEVVAPPRKEAALAALLEHLAPGRQAQVRPGNAQELAATTVLRLSLAEAAAKERRGPPIDDTEDLDWPVWAGVLPLHLAHGAPQADPACDASAAADPPPHVRHWTGASSG